MNTEHTVSQQPRFRLLRYFSTMSAIMIGLTAIVLGLFYGRIARSHLMTMGERNNIALTQAFANSIWPQFSPFLTSSSQLGQDATQVQEALRAHPETAQLRRAVLDLMQGLSVVKVKIYTLDGQTVFSTQASQIGEDKSGNAGFQSARAGRVASELTHRDSFSAFEQMIEDRDVLSSYLPIHRGQSSQTVEGVFEIYTDVTPLLLNIKRTQKQVVIGVTLGLGCLYAVLFLIVRRADRIIRHQHSALEVEIRARQQAQAALSEHNANLEVAVQQRTAQLEEAKEVAETANRAKSEFLANMSHELRTPLHSILSFADLGLEKVDKGSLDKLSRYLEQITQGGTTLLRLVDALLDLAKLEAGKMEFEFQESDLGRLLATVADEFSSMLESRQLSVHFSPPTSAMMAYLDPERIKQVVRNLMSNAVKFSPEGSNIELSIEQEDQTLVVHVRDHGPGIPEAERATIFEKFVQSSLTNTGAGGTGLGLAICREIIEVHQGRLWVDNAPDGGSVFSFALGREKAAEVDTTPVVEEAITG